LGWIRKEVESCYSGSFLEELGDTMKDGSIAGFEGRGARFELRTSRIRSMSATCTTSTFDSYPLFILLLAN
jgi:hypothetical protein